MALRSSHNLSSRVAGAPLTQPPRATAGVRLSGTAAQSVDVMLAYNQRRPHALFAPDRRLSSAVSRSALAADAARRKCCRSGKGAVGLAKLRWKILRLAVAFVHRLAVLRRLSRYGY
ncbi:hypothetical protein DIPPA_04071 [Diplonema papillatum]|nr:hypothetical protein DIPPA_04071 [Diplonema papillatum]